MDILYNNPKDAKLKVKNPKAKVTFDKYIEYMEKQMLELEISGLTPVTAQIAFIELRNIFFNQVDEKDASRVIESVLQKPFDANIYSLGIQNLLKEYIKKDIKENLGMSFAEYLKVPFYIKESLFSILDEKDKEKSKAEKEELKKRERNLKNIKG